MKGIFNRDQKKNKRFEPTVEVAGINYSFGGRDNSIQVLFRVNLTIYPGEVVLLTGPSGSGKTTLLSLIGGLRTVKQGHLMVMGENLCGMTGNELQQVRRNIGFIFQTHNLFESLTARQTLVLAMQLHNYSKEECLERPVEILNELGLSERMYHKPDALSEGQRQRVAIGRALINNPQIILADEPTAALDKNSGRQVVDILSKRAREEECTIMIVTHDNRILDVADRVIKLVDGHITSDAFVKDSLAIGKAKTPQGTLPSIIKEIADSTRPVTFAPGETVIEEGAIKDRFYYINSGTAEIVRKLHGQQTVVEKLGPGDLVGEMVLLNPRPRTATIRAREKLSAIELPAPTFNMLIQGGGSL